MVLLNTQHERESVYCVGLRTVLLNLRAASEVRAVA